MQIEDLKSLLAPVNSKIVLLVMDGLGGLPMELGGKTELETALTPNMDKLAAEGILGQSSPIGAGITPGSGPAHLSLFGIDPVKTEVGRGVLEAFGVGMLVKKSEVAARGNFCTLDANGLISDRRAGRIPSDEASPICEKLKAIKLPGVEVEVKHVKEYRFAVVMRGEGLSPDLEETDPQRTGAAPLLLRPKTQLPRNLPDCSINGSLKPTKSENRTKSQWFDTARFCHRSRFADV